MAQPGYDLTEQARLAAALSRPGPLGPGPVTLIQTHVSWVFLTDAFAYKLKKALDLGFLDYSTLERRRFCGEEELRLNRRTAPELYLDLIPVAGPADAPQVGGEPARDYLVRMRRFPDGVLFSELLAADALQVETLDALARTIARFHLGLPPAPTGQPFGTPDAVHHPVRQNFIQVAERLPLPARRLIPLREWSEAALVTLTPYLTQRRSAGWIRECHGDLHLGNIALIDGAAVPFDGIEFNPALRFIDVMSEMAFLTMDLEDRGRPQWAARVLNGYLEQTGDYGGLVVLRYYQCYRAMVRAKVAAIRLSQEGLDEATQHHLMAEFEGYAELAARYATPGRPALIITRGPSGSGKSWATAPLLERLGALRLRSDVERKRLFGLAPDARSGSAVAGGIYTPEATGGTYARLLALAEQVLAGGFPVIVDATFPDADRRAPFRALAERLKVPFVLLEFDADPATLRARVAERLAAGADPSEADAAVLEHQLAAWAPLPAAERPDAVEVAADGGPETLAARVAARLEAAREVLKA